jgi:hypothetical protein
MNTSKHISQLDELSSICLSTYECANHGHELIIIKHSFCVFHLPTTPSSLVQSQTHRIRHTKISEILLGWRGIKFLTYVASNESLCKDKTAPMCANVAPCDHVDTLCAYTKAIHTRSHSVSPSRLRDNCHKRASPQDLLPRYASGALLIRSIGERLYVGVRRHFVRDSQWRNRGSRFLKIRCVVTAGSGRQKASRRGSLVRRTLYRQERHAEALGDWRRRRRLQRRGQHCM